MVMMMIIVIIVTTVIQLFLKSRQQFRTGRNGHPKRAGITISEYLSSPCRNGANDVVLPSNHHTKDQA